MSKKLKIGLAGVLGTAYGLANQAGIVPDAEGLYSLGKDALIGAKNEIELKNKNDKIRNYIIEIGERVINKKILIDDSEIRNEIECVNELEEKINKLCKNE